MSSISYQNKSLNQGNVEAAFVIAEDRTGYPKLEWLDGGAFAAAGGDIVLKGSDLMGGNTTLDSYQLVESAVKMTVTALKPGNSGISVEMVPGVAGLAVTYDAGEKHLTITLASGGSTADAVATAINADASQANGILMANVDGAGTFTLDIDSTDLTGGVGEGEYAVYVSGVEALPANTTGTTSVAKWSATAITCTVANLTSESDARAAGDLVNVKVVVNGVESDSLTVVTT